MYPNAFKTLLILALMYVWHVKAQTRQNTYAHILQDTRNEPTPDGNFGYLYKTEDGIVSSARGDPSGKIQGTFSYTDPTGLKVNINYNAGSRFDRRKNEEQTVAPAFYDSAPERPTPRTVARRPAQYREESQYREEPQYYSQPDDGSYEQPQPQYRPRGRFGYQQDAGDVYQQRRGRPLPRENDVYDDYYYRG